MLDAKMVQKLTLLGLVKSYLGKTPIKLKPITFLAYKIPSALDAANMYDQNL